MTFACNVGRKALSDAKREDACDTLRFDIRGAQDTNADIMKTSVVIAWAWALLMLAAPPSALGQPTRTGAAPAALAKDVPERIVVPFSDPSRAGTVHVRALRGTVSITVATGRDVVVSPSGVHRVGPGRRGDQAGDPARADGLRRLDQRGELEVREEGNVVTVITGLRDANDLSIAVPARTNLQVNIVSGGVTIEGVDGEIEANSVNGPVTLLNVSGAVIAHSVNGEVRASLRQPASVPMAFTSLNGDVDVTMPGEVQANLRLRSDRGEVFTDFAVQTTRAPVAGQTNQPDRRLRNRRSRGRDTDMYRIERDRSIYGTINGGGPELDLRTFNGNIYLRRAK
ncbi:MAG: DUF4097 domain-containing protein [Vicinamibacterales bacterium]